MKRDKINVMIRKAYGERYGLVPEVVPPRQPYFLSKIQPVFGQVHPIEFISQRKVLVSSILSVLLIVGVTAYYYNGLMRTWQDMLTATGNVEALLQRRHDTAINLSRTVLDYAKHEQTVMNEVTKLRSGGGDRDEHSEMESKGGHAGRLALRSPELERLMKQGKASEEEKASMGSQEQPLPMSATQKDSVFSTLTTLLALAEQYPDLKLSGNFQNLMNAANEWEKALAEARISCNEKINIYTTKRALFPSNIFAMLFRFPDREYFEADEDAKRFAPIDY
jgi:LemA protein